MARISDLPLADPITGAETMPVNQDGQTRQANLHDVLPFKPIANLRESIAIANGVIPASHENPIALLIADGVKGAYFDAGAVGGAFQEIDPLTASTPADETSEPLGVLKDLSGSGFDILAYATGRRPVLEDVSVFGEPGIFFDNSGQTAETWRHLRSEAMAQELKRGPNGFALHFAYKGTASAVNFIAGFSRYQASNNARKEAYVSTFGGTWTGQFDTARYHSAVAGDTGDHLVSIGFGAGRFSLKLDGIYLFEDEDARVISSSPEPEVLDAFILNGVPVSDNGVSIGGGGTFRIGGKMGIVLDRQEAADFDACHNYYRRLYGASEAEAPTLPLTGRFPYGTSPSGKSLRSAVQNSYTPNRSIEIMTRVSQRLAFRDYLMKFPTGSVLTFALWWQSNEVGTSPLDGGPYHPPGTKMWEPVSAAWVDAAPPIPHNNQANVGFFGPDVGISRAIYELRQDISSSFIGCGRGATGFATNHWRVGDQLQVQMVERVNAAMAAAPANYIFAGVHGLGGEADMSLGNTGIAADIDAFIDEQRSAITAASSTTPFILGGPVPEHIGADPDRMAIAAAIADTPNRRDYVAVIDNSDFKAYDGLHTPASDQRTAGYRSADAWFLASQNFGALV